MTKIRIWHLMVVVAAVAMVFGVKRCERRSCSPSWPFLAMNVADGILCMPVAIWRGMPVGRCLLMGLLLGPLGLIYVGSEPLPEDRKGRCKPGRNKPDALTGPSRGGSDDEIA